MSEENEIITVPPKMPQFSFEQFKDLTAFDYLYQNFHGSEAALLTASVDLAENARDVGFPQFNKILAAYLKDMRSARRNNLEPGVTEFTGQVMALNCGEWLCADWGISRDGIRGKEVACAHPILPVERLRNLDTGEIKYRLAFMRSAKTKKWDDVIVSATTISRARDITSLSEKGISVTSSTASTLVDYLNDMENLNYDLIPESKSIGRLGYIPGEGFSPYVPDLVFDGDASFRHLYDTIKTSGSVGAWYDAIMECRRMSVTARIMIAASFAAPILSIVGALPFFVHLWGVDSGTGKTVALMAAASVWGNPALGSFIQTFNATNVGLERVASFLNHLPMCLDELQLTKDSHGRSNFDVYQLAQGVGRARGKRTGGVEMTPTWSCCFLTTGESPIYGEASGAGAINRVLNIECTAGDAVIKDGQRISSVLKQNYGHAGPIFVEKLYSSEKMIDQVRQVYNANFHDLRQGDSTEKQAMAAAAILTADFLTSLWIYHDDGETLLTADEIGKFLASRDAVSAGKRAYDWLCDWVASNVNHFYHNEFAPGGDVYGVLEGNRAYINRSAFNDALQKEGYSSLSILSYLRANRLIEDRAPKSYTKSRRIGGVRTECVVLLLEANCWADTIGAEEMLPL